MKNTRSKNAILNIVFGYFAQIGIMLLSFIGRKIFLNFLSVDYLGVNGLFSNVLTVLSLAELGLDTAFVYSLYKPIAEDNKPLIHSLLTYFRKIYILLAIFIFLIGLAVVPFLRFIVKSELEITDLVVYYILFLIQTISTYFVAHKVALLSAFQQQRVQKIVALCTNLLAQILHIIVLILWKNYYIYIVVTILTTIISNFCLSSICNKLHKEVFTNNDLVEFDTKPIKNKIFSTLLYKVGTVAINNTDNILMSMLVSTIAVGLYSNYFTVLSAIQGFITIITVSLISGIGNLSVEASNEKKYSFFKVLQLLYNFLATYIGIGLYFCVNDLISMWLGNKYLFDDKIVFVIVLNFYLTNAISPVYMYREANGMFERVRYLMLIRATLNIGLSLALGKFYGVFGVLLATALSLFMTNFWYEPKVLFHTLFDTSSKVYWCAQAKYFLVTLIEFIVCYFLIGKCSVSFGMFVFKILIITVTTAFLFFLVIVKTEEFRYMKKLVTRYLRRYSI